jgi:putative ABC transport system permease protein
MSVFSTNMSTQVQTISLIRLAVVSLPAFIVIAILIRWKLNFKNGIYAVGRMLLQLLLIGYFLTYIFESQSSMLIMGVLAVMLISASWIALGCVKAERNRLYPKALLAIFLGGGFTLVLVTQGVLQLTPWFLPKFMVPISGMIFANSMNSISLTAERFYAEINRGLSYESAKKEAFQAALLPLTNSLFAVGLVSIPGMMTGQILSGISPLIAARYQIMVMLMIFGSAGISAALFLRFIKRDNYE